MLCQWQQYFCFLGLLSHIRRLLRETIGTFLSPEYWLLERNLCLEQWFKPVSPRQLVECICLPTGHFYRLTIRSPHLCHLCSHWQSSRAAALPSPCLCHPMSDTSSDQPCPCGSYTVSDPRLGVQRWEKGGPFPALKQLSSVSSGTIEPLVFILSLSG